MQRDKYSIYLDGFQKRFVALNLKHASKVAGINDRVAKAVRYNISIGSINKHNIEKHQKILSDAFLFRVDIWYAKEMEGLDEWSAETLTKLFPELNEPQ